MFRKLPIALVILAISGAVPAGSEAYLPAGFIGVAPQSPSNARDFELMRRAGVRSVRLQLNWGMVESGDPELFPPDWRDFDHGVELAAEARIEVMPFVLGTPEWVAPEAVDLPVSSALQRGAWTRFLRAAADRYGPGGEFWELHPGLTYLPVRRWEIWNEENIVSFASRPQPARFAKLIRISGRTLHAADPGAEVIVGGLFGRPLQVPPNVASGDFLNRLYRAGDVKPFFDGVALHPYVADASAMGGQLRNLRRIMRAHQDAATPIYVTELGWGSQSGPTRWQRGLYGQADQLSRAFAILSANRTRWRIGGAWWFTWSDEGGGCVFCSSAGLLTESREAKPSWYRFNAWTGGNPDTVPRLKLRPDLTAGLEPGVAGD